MRYFNEKELIEQQLWKIVLRELGDVDDVGMDWFTIGNHTYIGNTDYCVSTDPEIAKLVNAINALNGYTCFIDADVDENGNVIDKPEKAKPSEV